MRLATALAEVSKCSCFKVDSFDCLTLTEMGLEWGLDPLLGIVRFLECSVLFYSFVEYQTPPKSAYFIYHGLLLIYNLNNSTNIII